RTRLLPHTDPFNRQITIGLGCFLEVLRIAALEDGLAAEMMLFPEGSSDTGLDDRPVARIRFVPTQRPGDPLFAQIQARHTLKEPYDLTQPVSDAAMQALKSAVRYGSQFDYSLDPDHIAWLREVTHDALRVEVETDATYRESVDVMRIGAREVNANPDGIDFSGPMFEMLGATGVMTRASLLDQSSTVFKQGMAAVLENADTAMGHFWMMTQTNTRGDQIMLGCDWVRVHLAATAAGVDLQPLSQALQEYPEVRPYYDAVHGRLAPQGQTVQMLARVGYGPKMPPSPRWPIDAKVVNA
ncbi:MAG: twin-arginine translocation pathway signal protein, partial [Pseudomonadota bacterium]